VAILDFLSRPLRPGGAIEEDIGFSEWYRDIAEESGLSRDPDDPRHYYDYRSAYEAGVNLDEDKHLPSRFKHDLHPNRYIIDEKDLSIYDTKHGKQAKFEDLIIQSFQRKEYEEGLWPMEEAE
jgi:hypothetical protein|tara:strand:+ start:21 stop:389 length:369 start_codon:yes stop_codon:yes gene_type:complete